MGRNFVVDSHKRKEERIYHKRALQQIRKKDSRDFEHQHKTVKKVYFGDWGFGQQKSAQTFLVTLNYKMKCPEILERLSFAFNVSYEEVIKGR